MTNRDKFKVKIGIFHLILAFVGMWISGYLWCEAKHYDRRIKCK